MYHSKKYKTEIRKIFMGIVLSSFIFPNCKKLVTVNAPTTSVSGGSVYTSDATAISALTYIYTSMSANSSYFLNSGIPNLSVFAGLSADEFNLNNLGTPRLIAYYTNALSSSLYGPEFWTNIFAYVYDCNASIDGLNASSGLTPVIKQQLLGEAKFMRAFLYFYLVNLYGDVPLALTSDYTVNASLARSPSGKVYEQIISDLTDAQSLLSGTYLDGTLLKTAADRVRPTKWAALALKARVYLYMGDYPDAESSSDSLINNAGIFSLSTLSNAFLRASLGNNEAIWQLQAVGSNTTNTYDAVAFIIPSSGPSSGWPISLSGYLINAFEPNDNRRSKWVDSVIVGGVTYYYAYKYEINTPNAAVKEYLMMMRLGEQFLIRAEARAQQGNISGAQSDLNAIRTRAGLPNTNASTQAGLLSAILHERQVELFTELGHRWFDLKRSGNVNSTLGSPTNICAAKQGIWSAYDTLYPVPLIDLQRDLNLVQNPGY